MAGVTTTGNGSVDKSGNGHYLSHETSHFIAILHPGVRLDAATDIYGIRPHRLNRCRDIANVQTSGQDYRSR
jgi:uncharacterized UBP type Zn finger protein